MKEIRPLLLSVLVAFTVSGCATPRTGAAETDPAKAEKKIAFAIGQEPGSFSITSQRAGEAPGGSVRTEYTVSTKSGQKYACYIYEPSGFGKAMSWGMASGSDAVCSEMAGGGKPAATGTKQSKPSCNDLLKAAGKCG